MLISMLFIGALAGSDQGTRRLMLRLVLASTLVVLALVIWASTLPRTDTIPNTTSGDGQDLDRYYHCAELRRIQSRWYSYPKSDMWERIGERYDRECPDHGTDARDDIYWTADLPPEPPEDP